MSRHLDGSPQPVAPLYYVSRAHFRANCACGRSASIPVGKVWAFEMERLIRQGLPAWRAKREAGAMKCWEIIERMRCSACGRRPPASADVGDYPGPPFMRR